MNHFSSEEEAGYSMKNEAQLLSHLEQLPLSGIRSSVYAMTHTTHQMVLEVVNLTYVAGLNWRQMALA